MSETQRRSSFRSITHFTRPKPKIVFSGGGSPSSSQAVRSHQHFPPRHSIQRSLHSPAISSPPSSHAVAFNGRSTRRSSARGSGESPPTRPILTNKNHRYCACCDEPLGQKKYSYSPDKHLYRRIYSESPLDDRPFTCRGCYTSILRFKDDDHHRSSSVALSDAVTTREIHENDDHHDGEQSSSHQFGSEMDNGAFFIEEDNNEHVVHQERYYDDAHKNSKTTTTTIEAAKTLRSERKNKRHKRSVSLINGDDVVVDNNSADGDDAQPRSKYRKESHHHDSVATTSSSHVVVTSESSSIPFMLDDAVISSSCSNKNHGKNNDNETTSHHLTICSSQISDNTIQSESDQTKNDKKNEVKVFVDLRLNGNDRNAIVYGVTVNRQVLLSDFIVMATRYVMKEFGRESHLHRLSRIQLDCCDVLIYETIKEEKSFIHVPLLEGEHLVVDALRALIKKEQ